MKTNKYKLKQDIKNALDKGSAYLSSKGKICMIHCIKCKRENYSMAVSSGQCAFCGYDPNERHNR